MFNLFPGIRTSRIVKKADKAFRDYTGLEPLSYKVKVDPKTRLRIKEMEGSTSTTEIGGSTNGKTITFPGVPLLSAAEHEIAHTYHMCQNHSLQGLNLNELSTKQFFYTRLALFEAVAQAFTSRTAPDVLPYSLKGEIVGNTPLSKKVSDLKDKFEWDSKPFSDKVKKEWEIICSNDTPSNSIDNLTSMFYNVGSLTGTLFHSDWDTTPTIESEAITQGNDLEIILKINIEQIDLNRRKAHYKNLLLGDYTEMSEHILDLYTTKIEPWMQRGYALIGEKLDQLL